VFCRPAGEAMRVTHERAEKGVASGQGSHH
jgi:hypothetical protein